ncbi:MAG: SDR family NAD(P)-dependent oxidoreductase, partial [Pseudolabrys sp.]
MDLNLKGRVAVVTGGAAGIGEAIASALSAEGCTICIVDRNADAGRQAASAIATRGNPARSAVADVGDPAEVTRVFGEFAATEKRIDILVNAAGLLSTGLVADLGTDEWRRVSRVNLDGVLYCAKAAIPIMSKQRYGRIINIASVS